jgi:type I restriction enzyme M protein
MLDNGTKKRIDSARDILVGKVPDPKSQVEQITIAMIYKFMDDVDNQTEELGGKATFFAGEFKQHAWSRLLDHRFSGHERLLLYAEGIEKMNMNENIPQLFRDIFKGAFLPYRDPETLNLFLKEINGFTYDHSERLGDAFEYLLSVLSSQGDAGQFRTPRHIIDFIVEIVNPAKEDTVLDPACGTAGFLISSYKHILSQNTKNRPGDLLTVDDKGSLMTNFCGYDISPDMVRLSLVNMYLHSFANPLIYEYDTLTSEDRWDERYDVILANPPFMSPKGGIRPHSRFTIKAKRSEVLFVDYIAEHLNVHGRAGVIVPEGIIFQSQNAYKNLRKMLVEDGYVYAVASLPAGIFQPYSGVKTSILLMDKTLAKKTNEILFVKVANDGFDLGAQRRPIDKNDLPQALKIVKGWKQVIGEGKGFELDEVDKAIAHTVSKEEIAESGDYNLSGDRYRENVELRMLNYEFVEIKSVTEVITKGTTPTSVGYTFMNAGINFVKIEAIREDGHFLEEKFAFINDDCNNKLERSKLQEGDVLFSIAGALGRAAVVTNNILPANTNQALSIIRPIRDKLSSKFLFWMLKSDHTINEIVALKVGVAQFNLSLKQIGELQIPLPPLEVQQKIVAELDGYQKIIDGAKQVVENYKPTIKIDPDWPMVKVQKICDLVRGSSPRPKADPRYYGGNVPRLMISDITRDGMYTTPSTDYLTEEGSRHSRLMKKREVVMAVSGNPGLATILKMDAYIHDGFVGFRNLSSKLLPEYFYFVLTHFKEANYGQSIGAVFKNLNTSQIKKWNIPLPPLETQQKIVAEIESESELVEANRKLIGIFEKKIKNKINEVWGE